MNNNKQIITLMEKDNEKLHTYVLKFQEQLGLIESLLEPNEKIAHCTDSDSFKGAFYRPEWIATSHARVWSLRYKKWLRPQMRTPNKFSYANILVSRLVANYFCDKKVVEMFGEENVEVHHMKPLNVEKPDNRVNYASNLQYIRKDLHREITLIQYGYKLPEYIEFDRVTENSGNSIAMDPRESQIRIIYKEDGSYSLNIKCGLKEVEIND